MIKLKPIGLSAGLAGLGLLLTACGGGGSGSSSSGGSVTPPVANRAPSVSLLNLPAEIREGETLSFTVSGSDPDNDSLSFTLATTQGPDLGLSLSGLTGSGTAPAVDANTTATIQVTASDGSLSATDTAEVTILNNAAPAATLQAADSAVREGDIITIDASASEDAEGDPLTYSYAVVAGPDVDLSGQTGSLASFTAPDVGADVTLTVEVSVNDGRDTSTQTVNITVLNNEAPIASLVATPASVDEGENIEFDASASSDPEADDLSYSYVQIAGPVLDLDDAAERFTTAAPEVEADVLITLEAQVSDGRDVTTQRVDVEVKNVVQSPAFPVSLKIEESVSVSGELFDIEGFLNPTTDGLIAVSDIEGGLVGLRTIRVAGDATFAPGSTEVLTPQFERGAKLRQGLTSLYTVTESGGITFLQQDSSQADAVFQTLGTLEIESVCVSEFSFQSSSAGDFLVVGREGGVDLFTYSVDDQGDLDFGSLTRQDSVEDGSNYCAFSALSSVGSTSQKDFIGFDANSFEVQRFVIDDDGAGGITLSADRRHTNPDLPVGNRRFVKGLSRPGFVGAMAVIVADETREGAHSLQYIVERFGSTDIGTFTGDWTLGTPSDLAFVNFDSGAETYIFAATPDTPQAIGFRLPEGFTVASGPLEATYLDVGLGASIAYGTRSAVGDNGDNGFHGLILGFPETGQITRFDSSDLP